MFSRPTDPNAEFEVVKINVPKEICRRGGIFPVAYVYMKCKEFGQESITSFCYRIGVNGVHMTRLLKPTDATLPQSYETTLKMVEVLNPILETMGYKTQRMTV